VATLIYSCDYSALANATLTAGGAHVIDGLTWYAKGSLAQGGNTYTRNLVNGSGLSLIASAGVASTSIGSSGNLDVPHWFLPLSQIPGYDAAEPHLFRARFKFSNGTNVCGARFGLCSSTDDAVGLRAADRAKDHIVGTQRAAGVTSLLVTKNGASSEGSMNARTGAIVATSCVLGLQTRLFSGTTWEITGSETLVSGMPASVTSFLPAQAGATGAAQDPLYDPSSRTNAGVLVAVSDNTAPPAGIYLEQLSVWRLTIPTPDTNPPTISGVSPASPGALTKNGSISFTLANTEGGWSIRLLQAGYGDAPIAWDDVYEDGTFKGAFTGSSYIGNVVTLVRAGGWPYGATVKLRCAVVDAAGNVVVINA